jgi:hypothetical protein
VAALTATIVTAGAVFGPHTGTAFPEEVNGCSVYGTGTPTNEKGLANKLKNRFTFPDEDADIDTDVSFEALTTLKATSTDPKSEMEKAFKQEKAGVIAGYIVDVIPGGEESCNCKATKPEFKDTHIYIGATPAAKKSESVIVEITPRIRMLKAKEGVDWSTTELKKLKGKFVHVTGWLFFDGEHWPNAADNPKAKGNVWRKTCWELHPVTDLQEAAP